ncbi:MAG: hypothetical protein NVSMB57_00040 [Actinomycetota bacterium]
MIPNVDEFRSDPMTHRLGDMFNPPALTNFLGCVQADLDPVAIRALSFPPFAAGWMATGALFVNGVYFHAAGSPVTFTWYPDRIVRECTIDGWRIRSVTALAVGEQAVMVSIDVLNERAHRDLELRVALRGGVTRKDDAWRSPFPPQELDNDAHTAGNAVVFNARGSKAAWVQAGWPSPAKVALDGITWRAPVGAGAAFTARFTTVMAEKEDDACSLANQLLEAMPAKLQAVRDDWNAELAAVFTPGNDRFSGSLPLLETNDEDIRKIYNLGALGVVYFKRDSPASFIGRTYDTLMPSFWQTATFLWDYSLSGQVHAMLDPHVMRKHLEHWMATDVHTCFGTEWLTGAPMGAWYAVNDYAMSRLISDYVRFTGDRAWLSAQVPLPDGKPMTVRDHLHRFAGNWEAFRTPNGLADYGGIGNLLECVASYVHEVASLNAGNVWSLRAAADIAQMEGDEASAKLLRVSAESLLAEVRTLYADGAGTWNARDPHGNLVPVTHCYDFLTVLQTIGDDLTDRQRGEMADFAMREYRTPSWMRALSIRDPDAYSSTRPDHQWTGAYTAWPPLTIAGLYKVGRVNDAFAWLKDLAKSGNQGIFGQAHFAEDVFTPEGPGAIKASADFPYITDWACSSSGAWVQVVIESIFGVRARVDGSIDAAPAFGSLDPSSRLKGLRFQGRLYDVTREGIVAQ